MNSFASRNLEAQEFETNSSGNAPGMVLVVLTPRSLKPNDVLTALGVTAAQFCSMDSYSQVRLLASVVTNATVEMTQVQFDALHRDLIALCSRVSAPGAISLQTLQTVLRPVCVRPLSTSFASVDARKAWDEANPDCTAIMVQAPVQTNAPQSSQSQSQPEQQWVAGVPNWMTGATALVVLYAIYKTVSGGTADTGAGGESS